MNKRRIAGLVFLFFHDGLTPNINVITAEARPKQNNYFVLSHMPPRLLSRLEQTEPNDIVMPEREFIELYLFIVEGISIMAGFSDVLYTLIVTSIKETSPDEF